MMVALSTPPRLASLPGLAAFGCLCRTLVQLPPRRYRRRAIPAAVCAPLLACASALRACCHSEASRVRRSHSSLYLPELVPACAAGSPAAFLHCAAAANSARAIASAHCAAFAQHRRRPWVPSVARHHWLPLVFDATPPIQKILSRRGFPPRATSRCRRGCEPLGIRPATRACPAELGRAISGWSAGQRVSRRLQRVRSPLFKGLGCILSAPLRAHSPGLVYLLLVPALSLGTATEAQRRCNQTPHQTPRLSLSTCRVSSWLWCGRQTHVTGRRARAGARHRSTMGRRDPVTGPTRHHSCQGCSSAVGCGEPAAYSFWVVFGSMVWESCI